jgi:hypothetical protein
VRRRVAAAFPARRTAVYAGRPVWAPALALLVAAGPGGAHPVALARHEVRLRELRVGLEAVVHESAIPASQARAIHAWRRSVAGRIGSQPIILRVPGERRTFLLSDYQDPSRGEHGRRLVLVREERGGYRELDQSRPVGDSHLLRPVLFTGRGRTVVLAAIGTEDSWGLLVYELAGARIRELGAIDATRPGPEGSEEDPTPCARVELDGPRIVVRFECDLWLGSGNADAPLVAKPVVFREDGGTFTLVRRR